MGVFNKLKLKPAQSHIRPLPQVGKKVRLSERIKIYPWIWWTLLVLVLTFLVLPDWRLPTQRLSVGDICPNDIKAPFDFSVEDKATTILRQNEAVEGVPAVYDFDTNYSKVREQIQLFFEQKAKFYEGKQPTTPVGREVGIDIVPSEAPAEQATLELSQLKPEERWKLFSQQSKLSITLADFIALEESLFDQAIQNAVISLVTSAMKQGIVGSKNLLITEKRKGIIKRDINTKQEQLIKDVSQFLDMEQAREYIKNTAANTLSMDEVSRRVVVNLAKAIIHPNLFFNKSETEERKQQARQQVKPVFFQIKKGEMIIREGERVKEDQLAKYRALINLRRHHALPFIIPGLIFLSALVLYLTRSYIKKFRPTLDNKQLQLLVVIIVGTLLVTKLFVFIANILSGATPDISSQAYYYAIPFAAGALLVALLVDAQMGVLFAVVVATFAGLQLRYEFNFFLLSLLGGVGAVYGVTKQQSRTAILRAGLLVSGINVAIIIPFNLIKGKPFSLDMLYECLGGMAGGLIVATIASAALPFLESLFKITTDMRLLELSNLNQPVLKQLALEAPGTYHHSIIVGSLAEAAAEAISANPLLSRIGAYYHDIGKINKAEYFIENHPEADVKHQKLSPNMSGLIVISHVKDGLELANQYKLPPTIGDVIWQHHGTSLMRYFYHKAKEHETPLQTVNENDYRYSGPKPQTKEIGIIMLADAVEATSRSLTDPTPPRLRSMVKRVMNEIYHDGQLDECDLTLKDLSQIAESFVRILTSVFHTRIDYPEVKPAKLERNKAWKSKSKIGSGG
jgi:hypothetical protein